MGKHLAMLLPESLSALELPTWRSLERSNSREQHNSAARLPLAQLTNNINLLNKVSIQRSSNNNKNKNNYKDGNASK